MDTSMIVNFLIFPADNLTLGEVEYYCSEWYCFVTYKNKHAFIYVPEQYAPYIMKKPQGQ